MTNRFIVAFRCMPAALTAVSLMTGCRSVSTVRMYGSSDVPAGQLATLVVPWCVSLRTVDGVAAPATFEDELRLQMKPGKHIIEARYVVLYPLPGNDTEKIVSDYVSLAFEGEAGKTYTLCSKDPRSLEETRRYAAHVSLWIEQSTAGPTNETAAQTPAKPAVTLPEATSRTNNISPATAPKIENPDIQAQLQEIWEKAGEQDRKAFMNRVQPQRQ